MGTAVAGRVGQARWRIADWVVPHSHADKPGGTRGARQTMQPRAPVQGNKASKPPIENTCGGSGGGRNSQPHRRVCWRDPQGPRTYTNPPTQESAPEEPNLLLGSGKSD